MRQFLTIRFWMTLVALGALTGLALLVTRSDGAASIAELGAPVAPAQHRIDLVALVFAFSGEAGFALKDGVTTGQLQLIIDGSRTMVIAPGTPGEISCTKLAEIGQCVVAVDLLGNAVLWFSVIPSTPGSTVTLPGIVGLLKSNQVLLANGWIVNRASLVDLNCSDDPASLTDFVRRYGARSTTTFSYDRQQVVRATCTAAPHAATTTTVQQDETGSSNPGSTVVGTDGAPPDSNTDASVSGVG